MHASLVFIDESGFSLVSPLKRTWAPRGQTPTIRTSIEHHERVNLIGALRISVRKRKIKLHLQSYRHSLSGDEVMTFLEHLLRRIAGPIVLVWDRHPIHQRRKVQDFLEQHPRLNSIRPNLYGRKSLNTLPVRRPIMALNCERMYGRA